MHAVFPVFLPDLRPRAPVHVWHLEVDDDTGADRLCTAIDGEDGLDTATVDIGRHVFQFIGLDMHLHQAQWLHESLGIIEDDFMFKAGQLTLRVIPGREDFHGLHVAGKLEHAVGDPGHDVGCPGHQGFIVIPEGHTFAEPARHIVAQPRHLALMHKFTPDIEMADEVFRAAGHQLQAFRHDHEVHGQMRLAREQAHEAVRPAELRRP